MSADSSVLGDPNGCYATVIADSVSPREHRLTTMEIQFWRPVLAEFNTHRDFSRNSASSRAIPVVKQIERIRQHPAGPLVFTREQKGMQGGEALDGLMLADAESEWHIAQKNALRSAEFLTSLGVHKSVTNRLLEPFMWHRVIVSSTRWENFFDQRCSPLAQPEIRQVAEFMREALAASTPQFVDYDDFHLPYVGDDPYAVEGCHSRTSSAYDASLAMAQVSAARSARVSYLTHEGERSLLKDFDLYFGTVDGKRHGLVTAQPEHWSPLEHPATPARVWDQVTPGNFDGWLQLRHHARSKEQVATRAVAA